MTDMQAEYDAAVAERDELQAELGEAIVAGQDTAALKAKLLVAEQTVTGCALAIEAIAAANQRAERRAADDAAAKRQTEIEAHWKQAELDYADIVATANAVQRNFDKQAELLKRLHHQTQAFANNHRSLGCNGNTMAVLRNGNWLGQMLLLLRENVPNMRERMRGLYLGGFAPTDSITQHIPAFDAIFPPLAKREAA